jgi:hypothetical protein
VDLLHRVAIDRIGPALDDLNAIKVAALRVFQGVVTLSAISLISAIEQQAKWLKSHA